MLNRLSRVGGGGRPAGGAEEASRGVPHRADGERGDRGTVVVRAGPRPWQKCRLGLGLSSGGRQCREDAKKESERRTGQLPGVRVTAVWRRCRARHLDLDQRLRLMG